MLHNDGLVPAFSYALPSQGIFGGVDANTLEKRRNTDNIYDDHIAIVDWVLSCRKMNFRTKSIRYLARPLVSLLPVEELDEQFALKLDLQPRERSLLLLSKSIAQSRFDDHDKARAMYALLQFTTFFTVLISAFTTVFIALSTSTILEDCRAHIKRNISILALVFPALGTGAVAIVALYAPQSRWAQSSRSLATETQIHGQMATTIWNVKCEASASREGIALSDFLNDNQRRFDDAQSIANTVNSVPSDVKSSPPSPNR